MRIDWSAYRTEARPGGVLKYIYEPSMYPMSYMGSDGNVAGYEAELILMIADKLDMGVEISTPTLASIINFVQTGKADVASGCICITEERAKEMDFPVTHYVGGSVFVCRTENLPAADPDLNTAVIAVEVGTITEDAAREAYPDSEYIYVASAPDGFLAELEADGTLEDMKRRWIVEQNYDIPEIPKAEHPEYTIKIGTTGLAQPYFFYRNNALTGFDVEMMRLRWRGREHHPLAQGDELTLKLGRSAVTDSRFTYEAGENLLVVTL